LFSFLLTLPVLMAGCGESTAPLQRATVSGRVTIGGRPLKAGVIRFIPLGDNPGPKTTLTVTDGNYRSDEHSGPVVGRHRIEIDSTDVGGFAMDDEDALERLRASGTERIERQQVPPAFNTGSTLTAIVSADSDNVLPFDL
jgi:hypothetical protein